MKIEFDEKKERDNIRKRGEFTRNMEMKTIEIYEGQKPTEAQIEEIRAAAEKPDIFDEDCPEFTDEQLKRFKRVHEDQRRKTVTLRLRPATLRKAKSLGKGYTTVLAGIIEEALNAQ